MRVILAGLSFGLSTLACAQLFSNGSTVTHPGAGANGADVSMCSVFPDAGGIDSRGSSPYDFAVADDFTVTGSGWHVDSIEMFAYDINAPKGIPRWSSVLMEVHSGTPDGPLISSGTSTWEWSGIYRVHNGVENLHSTDRPIQRITGSFGVDLSPGNYWVVQSIRSLEEVYLAHNPPIMEINPNDPNDPITKIGNSMQRIGGTWGPGTLTSDWGHAQELSFAIHGATVPEPISMGLLGMGFAWVLRRRLWRQP